MDGGLPCTDTSHHPLRSSSTTTTHTSVSSRDKSAKTNPVFILSRNAVNVAPACGGGGGERLIFCVVGWWIGPGRFRGFADLSIFLEHKTLFFPRLMSADKLFGKRNCKLEPSLEHGRCETPVDTRSRNLTVACARRGELREQKRQNLINRNSDKFTATSRVAKVHLRVRGYCSRDINNLNDKLLGLIKTEMSARAQRQYQLKAAREGSGTTELPYVWDIPMATGGDAGNVKQRRVIATGALLCPPKLVQVSRRKACACCCARVRFACRQGTSGRVS